MQQTTQTLRIGLLGFGAMGRTHAWAVRNLPFYYGALPFRAEIAGVCTTSREKSERVADAFGIPLAVCDEDELIGRPDIDVIDICTPNNCHYGTLKKAESLINDPYFVKCNSCYLVNLRFVTAVVDHEVFLGNISLQMSHPKRKDFLSALNNYFGGGV